MSSSRRIALAAALLLVTASAGAAQEVPARSLLVPGAKVRLEWAEESTEARRGSVATPAPDSAGFVFRPSQRGRALRVQFASLTSLEVMTARNAHTTEGALIGLLAGAVAAYVLLPHQMGDLDPRPILAAPAGLVGALVGGLIGHGRATTTWVTIPLR